MNEVYFGPEKFLSIPAPLIHVCNPFVPLAFNQKNKLIGKDKFRLTYLEKNQYLYISRRNKSASVAQCFLKLLHDVVGLVP